MTMTIGRGLITVGLLAGINLMSGCGGGSAGSGATGSGGGNGSGSGGDGNGGNGNGSGGDGAGMDAGVEQPPITIQVMVSPPTAMLAAGATPQVSPPREGAGPDARTRGAARGTPPPPAPATTPAPRG